MQGVETDGRGAYVTPLPGGSLYMARLTPNASRDFYSVVPSVGAGAGDQMPFPATCDSASGIPRSYCPIEFTAIAGSRSRHNGGVQILFTSGTVRFVSNSIDHVIWIAIHSTSGGETGLVN